MSLPPACSCPSCRVTHLSLRDPAGPRTRTSWTSSAPGASTSPPSSRTPRPLSSAAPAAPSSAPPPVERPSSLRVRLIFEIFSGIAQCRREGSLHDRLVSTGRLLFPSQAVDVCFRNQFKIPVSEQRRVVIPPLFVVHDLSSSPSIPFEIPVSLGPHETVRASRLDFQVCYQVC